MRGEIKVPALQGHRHDCTDGAPVNEGAESQGGGRLKQERPGHGVLVNVMTLGAGRIWVL